MNISTTSAIPASYQPLKEKSEHEDTSASKSAVIQKAKEDLSSNELQQLSSLQQRDSEVRAHEAAHIAGGGSAVKGGASFSYEKGPDGQLYAVGGEVPISLGGGNSPQEKIANAQAVQAGALAPASPSPQDLKVAASASQLETQARAELALEQKEALEQKAQEAYKNNSDETVPTDKNYTPLDLSA